MGFINSSIKIYTIIFLTIIILGLCGISFLAMLPSDSGPEPSRIFEVLFEVLNFPMLVLLSHWFEFSFIMLFVGFLFNSIFYAFILERLIFICKKLIK